MTLYLEKRGLDFPANGPEDYSWSDCTNHRLFMGWTEDKEGRKVCGDFMHGARYDFSKKKPKLISDHQLFASLVYEHEDGTCRGYERARKVTELPYYGKDFTLANILEYVNSWSKVPFDDVLIVNRLDDIHV